MNLFRAREIELIYPDIWRIFISGSSSAGKTYFAKQLLSTGLMKIDRIYYFHPDIQEDFPVDWCDYFKDIPIVCESGLPTIDELNEMPPYSVVVLDDQFTECAESKLMSYLFRVLSSKKKLHLVIMTQRYFDMGSKGLNLRNCSNYHVLMSNTDVRTNHRVGFSMGLDKEIKLAEKINKTKLYPYIVIDRTNQARVNGVQVYTDILSKHKEVILNGNVFTVVPAAEFKRKHELTSDGFARKRAKMDFLDMLDDSLSDDSDSLFDPDQYSDASEDYMSEDDFPTQKDSFDEKSSFQASASSFEKEELSDEMSLSSDTSQRETDLDENTDDESISTQFSEESNSDAETNSETDGDADSESNSTVDSEDSDSEIETDNESDDESNSTQYSEENDSELLESDDDTDATQKSEDSESETDSNISYVYYTEYSSDDEF